MSVALSTKIYIYTFEPSTVYHKLFLLQDFQLSSSLLLSFKAKSCVSSSSTPCQTQPQRPSRYRQNLKLSCRFTDISLSVLLGYCTDFLVNQKCHGCSNIPIDDTKQAYGWELLTNLRSHYRLLFCEKIKSTTFAYFISMSVMVALVTIAFF